MEQRRPSGVLIEARHSGGNGHAAHAELEFLQERLVELEMAMAQDSAGWLPLGGHDDTEFSRDAIRQIGRLARLNYLKNPLIRAAVDTQMIYVFGQDMTIRAADDEVNEVIQAFLDDAKNKAEFTGHQSRQLKEIDLRLFGNIFFVFFIDTDRGRMRVRTLPVDQVEEIVCNPEDAKEPWFYLRQWHQPDIDGRGHLRKVAYPDWRYSVKDRPDTVRGYTVDWALPVYHIKTGGLSDMRFGVSEVYPALDWAKAYKAFLEDWATLTRAYSRFAHKMTVPTNRAIAGARQRLNTTYGDSGGETNPPPLTGSTFIAGPGTDLTPIHIGGANVSMEDGRRMLLMVAAAVGLPESFFGDVSVGTLATAKSLDRPTELRMRNRQTLWADVHQDIFRFLIEQAVRANALQGRIEEEDDGTPVIELAPDDTGEPRDMTIHIDFPPILEHDTELRVGSIIDAATMRGSPQAGLVAPETVSRLLLQALGVDEIDALLDDLYPEDDEAVPDDDVEPPTVTEFAAALRDLRGVVTTLLEDGRDG